MFGKRKKRENSSLNFKSENYCMKDNYKSGDLVVGNLEYVSSKYTDFGPMVETTKQRYIFEKIIEEDGKIRYREIFTGFIADTESAYFDLPYAVNLKPINEALENIAEEVPKYGLMLVSNEINKIQKVKVKAKIKKQ